MKVIGFDPSLRQTGYAVIEMENRSIVSAGIIKTNASKDTNERIFEIFKNAGDIIDKNKVEHAAFEESFYYKNVKTSNVLAQVRTALVLKCMERNLTLTFFSPNNIKKCLTGRGHASKEQVMYMVKSIFGLTQELPDDVSDAIAVAYTFLERS